MVLLFLGLNLSYFIKKYKWYIYIIKPWFYCLSVNKSGTSPKYNHGSIVYCLNLQYVYCTMNYHAIKRELALTTFFCFCNVINENDQDWGKNKNDKNQMPNFWIEKR